MAVDEPGPPADSNPAPPAGAAPPGTRRRSPVERAIVRGGILLLLIVALLEWRASDGLKSDSEAVLAAMETSEKGYLTESDLTRLMTRFSRRQSQTGLTANELAASRVDTFDYGGILKKRQLYVYFGLPRPGHEQEVLQIGEFPIRMYTPEDFGFGLDQGARPASQPAPDEGGERTENSDAPVENSDSQAETGDGPTEAGENSGAR